MFLATESFEEEGDPRELLPPVLRWVVRTCRIFLNARTLYLGEAEISRLRERLEATEKVMASIIGLMKSNNLDVPPLVSKEEQ